MKSRIMALAGVLLFVVLTVSFVGCSKADSDTIKIGGVFPLSGPVAVYGIEAKNGIELAIEEINAAGGVNGKMLELVGEDDEGSPEKSVNVYKKLVTKDKVEYIIGSLTSGCAAAIAPLAQAQKVLMLAPAATLTSITEAGDYVFRACFIDPFQGTVGGRFAAENLKAKKAAILYDIGNDYSIGLYENFKIAFEKAGGQVVAAESYSTGDKDFNAVYLPDYYGTVALIAKQLRAQGITAPMIGADGWDGIIDNAGDEVLNGFYSNHYAADSTDPRVVNFVKAYEAKFNSTPVSFAALAYDCVFLLKDAMEKSGKTDATTLKDTLKDISGSYVTGTLSFDENRNPVKSAVMMEIVKKDGKLTPVYNATINP